MPIVNVLKEKPLKNAYIGERGHYELFDETIIANSTTGSGGVIASVNGTFKRPSFTFGGGNGNYGKTTQDGFDVITASGTHGNCHIGISDATYNTLISDYKILKIVIDYFNIGSRPSQYSNSIMMGNNEGYSCTSSGINIYSNWTGITLQENTGYSIEMKTDTDTMNTKAKITKISTGDVQEVEYVKSFRREASSSYMINGGGPIIGMVVRDGAGGPVSIGNIHIYVS